MINSRSIYLLMFGLCLLMLGQAAGITADIFSMYREKTIALSLKPFGRTDRAMSSIDKALKWKLPEIKKNYDGLQVSPFGPEVSKDIKMPASGRKPVPTCGLVLKGVLDKEKPLAIIQDAAGQTYICTVGDTVCNMNLVAVSSNSVQLKNRTGLVKLSITEETGQERY